MKQDKPPTLCGCGVPATCDAVGQCMGVCEVHSPLCMCQPEDSVIDDSDHLYSNCWCSPTVEIYDGGAVIIHRDCKEN